MLGVPLGACGALVSPGQGSDGSRCSITREDALLRGLQTLPHRLWVQLQDCLPAEGAESPVHRSRRGWRCGARVVVQAGIRTSCPGNR